MILELILLAIIVVVIFNLTGSLVSFLITIAVGALIGWAASKIMNTDMQQGWLANILIGILGSLLGQWVFSDVFNVSQAANAGELSVMGILFGIAGAALLIGLLKLIKVFR